MKQAISLAFIALLFSVVTKGQVGIGTATPDTSAILELRSPNKGFLPARLALVATNSTSPVGTPATGLLVYNTATAGVSPNNVIPGYYYWDSSKWQQVVNKGQNFGDMQYWDGTNWVTIPLGTENQTLTICNGVPRWGSCATTVSLRPIESQYDGFVSQTNSVYNYSDQILVSAWTSGGSPFLTRGMLKMSYTSIPSTAVIDDAKLYLYSDLTPQNGFGTEAQYGGGNECYIERITSPWTSYDMYNWSNQPSVSTANHVTIPASTSAFENYVLDVTALVQDQRINGNNGFMIRLQTEAIYKSRQFASSRNADQTRIPTLVITYH